MQMLSNDRNVFESSYPEAARYLLESKLRWEAYKIACSGSRTHYEQKRLCELFKSPACREEWFLKIIRNDAQDIKDYLEQAGL